MTNTTTVQNDTNTSKVNNAPSKSSALKKATKPAPKLPKTPKSPKVSKPSALAKSFPKDNTPPKSPAAKPDVPGVELIDTSKLSKRLEDATKTIQKEVGGVVKSFCKIGYELYKVREEKLYLGQGFESVAEYGEKVLGFQKSSVANYISICKRFSIKTDVYEPTAQLKPEFEQFSYSQLSLMLSVPATKLSDITPDKLCSEIRELKKAIKPKSGKAKTVFFASAPAPSAPASDVAPVVLFSGVLEHRGDINKITEMLLNHIGDEILVCVKKVSDETDNY